MISKLSAWLVAGALASTAAAGTWRAQIEPTGDATVKGMATVEASDSSSAKAHISISGAKEGDVLPWHVHSGTCDNAGPPIGDASAYTATFRRCRRQRDGRCDDDRRAVRLGELRRERAPLGERHVGHRLRIAQERRRHDARSSGVCRLRQPAFSRRRAFTNLRTRETGRGRSAAKRIVPLLVSYPSSSSRKLGDGGRAHQVERAVARGRAVANQHPVQLEGGNAVRDAFLRFGSDRRDRRAQLLQRVALVVAGARRDRTRRSCEEAGIGGGRGTGDGTEFGAHNAWAGARWRQGAVRRE